jgi:uncharacterized membrane protein HdeD (DUF308 family)
MNQVADLAQGVADARKLWGWYFALGVVMILIGLYCIWAEGIATLASVLVLGVVLFVAGIAQIVGAFVARGAGHVILLLLIGALDIIVGLMILEHPELGALAITLFLAALFIFGGIFRFVSALALQIPNYGWVAAAAVLSIILGILLWTQWPISAIWFIGFVVGLQFVFSGAAWAVMGWKLKSA